MGELVPATGTVITNPLLPTMFSLKIDSVENKSELMGERGS